MTSVLNRKFDLLSRSGTCPPYLLDVLSLLVAHANDTELFKTELRAAPPAEDYDSGRRELQLYEERATEQRQRQLAETTAIDDAARASHETILVAAEQSLRTYAEDLRRINDVAIATSAKQLRELRASTKQDMQEFRDRLCEAAVNQSTRDVEVMRLEWLEEARAEAERLKDDVDRIAAEAENAIQQRAEEYAAFVAQAHALLNTAPAADAHAAMASSALVCEQMCMLSATAAAKVDVDLLADRMKQAERTIARVSAHLFGGAGGESGNNGVSPLTPSPRRPASAATSQAPAMADTNAPSTPARGIRQQAAHSQVSALPQKQPRQAAPAEGVSPVATLVGGSRTTSASAIPMVSDSSSTRDNEHSMDDSAWDVPAFGVNVSEDTNGNGLEVTAVRQGSWAEHSGLRAGLVISHVGRTAVGSADDFQHALDAVPPEETPVKLMVFDPDAGRVRILSMVT